MLRPPSCLFALALAVALPARAQSLQEVYEAARAYDAVYLAAQAQARAAQFRAEQERGRLRPRLDLAGQAGRNEVDPPASTQNPSGDRLGSNSTSLQLRGRQPLFNRASGVSIDQFVRREEQAQVALQAAEQNLIVRVAQAYFDVLTSQDALTAAQANKKAIGEQLASARRNFEVGTATITDTREAQARFDLATAQELAAENDLRTKRIALDQLVGRSNVTPKPLAVPVVLPATAPNNVEEWVTPSQNAPTVRRAQLELDITRLDIDAARAGHLPTVDAVATLGSSHLSGRATSGIPGTTNSATLGVELQMPLYTGGAVQNAVQAALSQEERARNDLEDARRTTAQNTRVAFFNVQSGQAQAKALEAAESSSKLALEATQLGYRVGVRVNLDVLNAQTQLFNTQRDLSKSRYDVLLASLRLRQAAGTLQPGDVGAVNALLTK